MHPDVLVRCREEQEQLGSLEPLSLDTLRKMRYLEQVILEVLRLVPPVGGGFRKVIHTCEFRGYQFPKDWNVLFSISFTHQDDFAYEQPEQFNPERFVAEEIVKSSSYVPFGGGLRECLGKELARLEMKLFAARLIRDYAWELLPSQNLKLLTNPVPRPKDGLMVKIWQR